MIERCDDLASLATREMGKPITQTRAEVLRAADILTYYADNAESLLADEVLKVRPRSGEVKMVTRSLGVIFAIEPWNGPYYQAMRAFAPNAAIGNVVVLKHAPNVPQSAAAIVQVLHDSGLPSGVLANVYLDRSQSARVIADRRVRGVTFTGGIESGRVVAEMAGKAMIKSVMELGGSDAFIVLEDADLDHTLACAVPARFYNSGQVCMSSKRMIVVEPLYEQFLNGLIRSANALRPGDPLSTETTIGPLVSAVAANRVKDQVRLAVEHGASYIPIGPPVPEQGCFVQPAILTDITVDNPIRDIEIFGPIAMVYRVPDEEAAVELANSSPFGLGGTVWSRDLVRARSVASRLDTGAVYINQPAGAGPDVPIGGMKWSGYGYELGRLGMLEFSRRTVVTVPTSSSVPTIPQGALNSTA